MLVPLVIFVITALGGLTLLALRLSGRPLPLALAVLHGGLGATGLLFLTMAVLRGGAEVGILPRTALGLLVLAALGGFFVFSFHLRRLTIPIPLIVVHGTIAASGIACLFVSWLQTR